MKALTLIQPWASLITEGIKTIETRSWSTKYRGPLAIHAGKKVDEEACMKFGFDPESVYTSRILCIVQLVDCVQFPNPKAPPDKYGDFTAGRYGWILEKPLRINPIKMNGSLGLWSVEISPATVLDAIQRRNY